MSLLEFASITIIKLIVPENSFIITDVYLVEIITLTLVTFGVCGVYILVTDIDSTGVTVILGEASRESEGFHNNFTYRLKKL